MRLLIVEVSDRLAAARLSASGNLRCADESSCPMSADFCDHTLLITSTASQIAPGAR